MFIIEQNDTVVVHDKTGRIVYESHNIVQYKKFNAGNLVVITEGTVDMISEVKTKEGYDVLAVSDTNFEAAVIYGDLLLIQRKITIPILDVYDSQLMNVLRLYQNTKGNWIRFTMQFGIPVGNIEPTHLDGSVLYGTSKGKRYSVDLVTNKVRSGKSVVAEGTSLVSALSMLKVGAK